MDNSTPLTTPIVVRSIRVDTDPFRLCIDFEQIMVMNIIIYCNWSFMYLANCTQPGIAFVVNLLVRFSSAPTKRQWNGIKQYLVTFIEQSIRIIFS